MSDESVLQPAWDFLRTHLGEFLGSPGFLLTAVVLGIYAPGVVFSIVDVFVAKRLTWQQCVAVYWRAMKGYGTVYVVALAIFIVAPQPFTFDIPATAPTLTEFVRDLVLYFLVGDVFSYWWHRNEHENGWYAKRVHRVHHADRPPLSIWTAMVVHPVEGVSVFVFFHLYGILFPIHLFTFTVKAYRPFNRTHIINGFLGSSRFVGQAARQARTGIELGKGRQETGRRSCAGVAPFKIAIFGGSAL